MATLFLMVGLPGAGKTALAKQLERERPALRLTPDDWIIPLCGPNLAQAALDACRDPVESVQWLVAARALTLGVDVVLDFGFWSQRERNDFRDRAAAIGARSELRFLDIPLPVLANRLAAGNADLPAHAFHVSEAQLQLWSSWFQLPTALSSVRHTRKDLTMTFKPAIWYPIAVVLSAVNVVAVGFAAAPGEPWWHATIHAALAVGFGVWAHRLRQGSGARELQDRLDALEAEPNRLEALESEMSRLMQELSETQERLDFAERLLAQRPEARRVDPPR